MIDCADWTAGPVAECSACRGVRFRVAGKTHVRGVEIVNLVQCVECNDPNLWTLDLAPPEWRGGADRSFAR